MKKREIIISIDDHCKEPFDEVNFKFLEIKLSKALAYYYDVEITKVEVRDAEPKLPFGSMET